VNLAAGEGGRIILQMIVQHITAALDYNSTRNRVLAFGVLDICIREYLISNLPRNITRAADNSMSEGCRTEVQHLFACALLPHKCGVPCSTRTLNSCGSEELLDAPAVDGSGLRCAVSRSGLRIELELPVS
jgi:hypothetical protein